MRALLLLSLAALVALAAAKCQMIPMRDGVKLHTCVDIPGGAAKPRTAVMDRSPYGQFGIELLADIWLLFDHVAVRQDMRGTGHSEGNFTIWHNAAEDGYDTMLWITNQTWSNGQVTTIGVSADGLASFMDISLGPPFLKAQCIVFAGSVGYPILYPGGAFREALAEGWLNGTVPTQAAYLIEQLKSNEAMNTPYWNVLDMDPYYGNVDFPSVMWAGWYDIFIQAHLIGWYGYQHQANTNWRGQSKMVVDPLGHCQAGSKYFPKHTIEGRSILPLLLAIDLYTNSTHTAENVKDVTFYVMGAYEDTSPANYWTTLDDFPAYTATNLYLSPDGVLADKPAASGDASYIFDPSDPVPSMGGNNLEIACGPLDQRPVENRSDVLVFTTEPLTADLWLTGPLSVVLYVGSNATDTDFTAKLTDVYADGTSRLIQDGIQRMRWRNNANSNAPTFMMPDQVYEIEISLWNTSYVFSKGHSLRVDISSSNYPRFSVNPNNGLALVDNGVALIAENTVLFNEQYPSHIVLPVIQPSQVPPALVVEDLMRKDWDAVDPRIKKAQKLFEQRVYGMSEAAAF